MAKLSLGGVWRRHPGAREPILSGLDLEVSDGEVLVLVGPSGCGKSTVLRLIAGLDLPDRGTIELDGRDLAAVAPQDRDVAMVFQGYALYPHMSVRDNIGFPLKMRGTSPVAREKKVGEAAELLGLGELLDRLPGELSGGERQRVAMGRALVRDPKLFLFDEPLSNLDAGLRTTLRVEVARILRKIGATAIYVTHDQTEAMTVGHRVAVMRAGNIEQLGAPRAIYEAPSTTFVAGFLGTPSMNQWPATIEGGLARIAGQRIEPPKGVVGSVIVAARPEHVVVRASDDPAPAAALSFLVRVVATEPLGAETILHCEGSGEEPVPIEVRAKVAGFFDVTLSDEVRISIPNASLAWFDAETGARAPRTA